MLLIISAKTTEQIDVPLRGLSRVGGPNEPRCRRRCRSPKRKGKFLEVVRPIEKYYDLGLAVYRGQPASVDGFV